MIHPTGPKVLLQSSPSDAFKCPMLGIPGYHLLKPGQCNSGIRCKALRRGQWRPCGQSQARKKVWDMMCMSGIPPKATPSTLYGQKSHPRTATPRCLETGPPKGKSHQIIYQVPPPPSQRRSASPGLWMIKLSPLDELGRFGSLHSATTRGATSWWHKTGLWSRYIFRTETLILESRCSHWHLQIFPTSLNHIDNLLHLDNPLMSLGYNPTNTNDTNAPVKSNKPSR